MRLAIKILSVAAVAVITACSRAPATSAPVNPQIYICHGTSCAQHQLFEIFDKHGSPIFSVGEFGGAGVFGDQLSVYAHNDVFRPVAQLRTNGTLMMGGQVITPRDIAFIHCLERHKLGVCQLRWRR